MKDYSKMTLEEMLKPAPKEDLPPFPPEENEFMEISYGAKPGGGDLSIAYFYNKDNIPCRKEEAAYINIVVYKKDGTRVNEFYGAM